MEEWERFKVGKPSGRPGWTNNDCVPFDAVTHTSHVGPALAIINDGEIRPSLVFDESRLNTQRILVSWLSPNYWGAIGSRYGNIDFQFNFNSLAEGRNYYWVEVADYKIPACRILITDIYRDLHLQRYDSTLGNGPWWFNKAEGTHYYNGNYCIEFMVEAPIQLTTLRSLDFIKHSDRYCAMHRNAPSRCPEFGFSDLEGAARFLTRAAVTGTSLQGLIKARLIKAETLSLKGGVSKFVSDAVPRGNDPNGETAANLPLAAALARAVMSAYTYGRSEEAELLAAEFKSIKEFAKATANIMGELTGIEDWFDSPYPII